MVNLFLKNYVYVASGLMKMSLSLFLSVKQIQFPSGTPLQANGTVSEKMIQSVSVSPDPKEQKKVGGRGEEKKMKEKSEKKGIFTLKAYMTFA